MVHEPDAANDVTQDTFLKAFEGLTTYRPESPFWPWIGAIASHTAVDHIRHQRRDTAARQAWLLETTPGRRLSEGIPAIDQSTSDPFNVDVARLHQELEEALPQLQEEYRRCYERRDLERQSYQRIAKELRMSEGTARKNVNRARRKLRQILGSIRRFLLENTPV
jgi:RNA polymerase sigma-70 factor (ECF subfamily)